MGALTITHAPLVVIEYEKLLHNDAAEAAKLLIASKQPGFFHLNLTGPATEQYLLDLQTLYRLQEKYFELPSEAKLKHSVGDARVEQGYKTFPDCQTFEIPRDAMDAVGAVPPMLDQAATRRFMATSTQVTGLLLDILSTGIGLSGDQHLARVHRHGQPSGCGLKFESVPTVEDINDVPPSEHTDSGSITLLWCEKYTTQLQAGDKDEWLFIEPRKGCAIVNIADALQKASGGRLTSRLHRVGQPENGIQQRLCVLYYLRPETATGLYDIGPA